MAEFFSAEILRLGAQRAAPLQNLGGSRLSFRFFQRQKLQAWMCALEGRCGDTLCDQLLRRIEMSSLRRVCLLVILVLVAIAPLFA